MQISLQELLTDYAEYVQIQKGLLIKDCNSVMALNTKYILLPHLSFVIDHRIVDKYCFGVRVQGPEDDECFLYDDVWYGIIERYQHFGVLVVGSDFCVVVNYPWSRLIPYENKCKKCLSRVNRHMIRLSPTIQACRFCIENFALYDPQGEDHQKQLDDAWENYLQGHRNIIKGSCQHKNPLGDIKPWVDSSFNIVRARYPEIEFDSMIFQVRNLNNQ